MSKEQIIESLKEEQASGDPEDAHRNADILLCQFLASLGYTDVVVEFEKIEKWYA